MTSLENRAKKVYKSVCKDILEVWDTSSISVELQFVRLYTTVAIIYVNVKNVNLQIENVRGLLSSHFPEYVNDMTNSFKLFILVQYEI